MCHLSYLEKLDFHIIQQYYTYSNSSKVTQKQSYIGVKLESFNMCHIAMIYKL